MEKIKIEIEKLNFDKLLIRFIKNSMSEYNISTSVKELKAKYNLTHYDLNYTNLNKIISDRKMKVIQSVKFIDEVSMIKTKDFQFQIEGSLCLITPISWNETEIFIQKNKIKNFFLFSKKDFYQLKLEKAESLTPITHNIQSSQDTSMESAQEFFNLKS